MDAPGNEVKYVSGEDIEEEEFKEGKLICSRMSVNVGFVRVHHAKNFADKWLVSTLKYDRRTRQGVAGKIEVNIAELNEKALPIRPARDFDHVSYAPTR